MQPAATQLINKFQKSIGEYYYTAVAKDKEDKEEEAKLKKKK